MSPGIKDGITQTDMYVCLYIMLCVCIHYWLRKYYVRHVFNLICVMRLLGFNYHVVCIIQFWCSNSMKVLLLWIERIHNNGDKDAYLPGCTRAVTSCQRWLVAVHRAIWALRIAKWNQGRMKATHAVGTSRCSNVSIADKSGGTE